MNRKRDIDRERVVWLASYPRSGNTLTRLILFHCFGVKTSSAYTGDLHRKLWRVCGVDPDSHYLKTHKRFDEEEYHAFGKAIYIRRDRGDVMASLDAYYGPGKYNWGDWQTHVDSWQSHPCLLSLNFAELKTESTLNKLSKFLKLDIVGRTLPRVELLQRLDPHMFRHPRLGALLER